MQQYANWLLQLKLNHSLAHALNFRFDPALFNTQQHGTVLAVRKPTY